MESEQMDRLLAEFGEYATTVVKDRREESVHDEVLAWVDRLRSGRKHREVLEEVVRAGADLPRLLLLGLLIRVRKSVFHEAWCQIRFGPASFGDAKAVNVERACELLDRLEAETGERAVMPDVPLDLRGVREHLRERNRQIQADSAPEVEAVTFDEQGNATVKKVRPEPDGAFVAALRGGPPEEVDPALSEAGGRGRPSDPAENALAVLVAGHVLAVTGEKNRALATRICTVLLALVSPSSPISDAFTSFKRRIERRWKDEAYVRRARLLSEAIGLKADFDQG